MATVSEPVRFDMETKEVLERIGLDTEETLREINSVSQNESRQQREDVKKLAEKSRKMEHNIKMSIIMLRVLAQDVNDKYRNCQIAKAVGSSSSLLGSLLSIAAVGATTVATGGAAGLLWTAGLFLGAAGPSTGLGAGIVQARISSKAIKKAEQHLNNTIDSIIDVSKDIQEVLMTKEISTLAFMYYVAKVSLELDIPDSVVKILYDVLLYSVKEVKGLENLTKGLKELPRITPVVAAELFKAPIADGVGEVIQNGAAQADDVVLAGSNLAGRLGKVVIVTNVISVLWDAIHLGFTIKDLIKNKGSLAAKILRLKADELESAIS